MGINPIVCRVLSEKTDEIGLRAQVGGGNARVQQGISTPRSVRGIVARIVNESGFKTSISHRLSEERDFKGIDFEVGHRNEPIIVTTHQISARIQLFLNR